MRLKQGVSLQDVSWRMFHAAIVAEDIYNRLGVELVITSANDSVHKVGSLHYKGMALDFRTSTLKGREQVVADAIRTALSDDYDVVLEKDHIHCEYDPKE